MEDPAVNQLRNIYGLNPDTPHIALQFPRLPPRLFNPMHKIFENPIKEKFTEERELINKKLEGFQWSYQSYAAGLMNMNSTGIIPPGHPLFNQKNSVIALKAENDKLLKENFELKKKLNNKKPKHEQ